MSEPRDNETRNTTDEITTEQLAKAGAAETGPAETRTFEAEPPAADGSDGSVAPIFPEAQAAALRRSWDAIQAGFVDEPRRAVEDADHLVAATMKRLAEMFSEERGRLESQWDRGDDVSTEDLRIALQRYRAFFGRLLSV